MNTRRHFYESIEREVDFQREYENLEKLCFEPRIIDGISINSWIEKNFRSWKKRGDYCSFNELREYLGYETNKSALSLIVKNHNIDINGYLLFCEMILNLLKDLSVSIECPLEKMIGVLRDTILATLEKCGLEIKTVDNEIVIVEKNAVATNAAECIPELSDTIMEYNQYLLRGDIKRKKILLKQMADSLEPKKKELRSICSGMADDFFYLVNSMDIRHNNLDPAGKNYNPVFASYSVEQREEWYDLIYEQGLAIIVIVEQQKRNKIIDQYKQSR